MQEWGFTEPQILFVFGRFSQADLIRIIKYMSSLGREKQVNNSKTYSNRSFKTNEDSTVVCNACKTSKEDMQVQIVQLKDKAHQSFMQVLQIQQLHQEELSQLREEWNEREQGLMAEVASLQQELRVLKYEMAQLQKNVNRHSYDFEAKELIIDNIDLIASQDNDRSYLDESALLQFRDLLVSKNGSDYVASLKRQIYRDIKFVSNNKTQIQKLFMIIKDLKDENSQLLKNNEMLKQKLSKSELSINQLKASIDNFNKQNKFICQNLKRLSNDKLKLQKRISDLQKTKMHEQAPSSPALQKHRSGGAKEEYSDKLNQPILEVSELSILKREINELNYAKFMAVDQVQNQSSHNDFHKKKKGFGLQMKESH